MKKILIVEDDKDISIELKALLENSGYEASILTDFKNASDEILRNKPDLVLLDINIPYMNGEMLLRDLRQKTDVPVIMVTSRDSEADEVLSMSYGADDYITKPYNPTILLLRINALLKRAAASSANNSTFYRGKLETVSEKMINMALFKQIGIFFAFPLLLAIIHSVFGIKFINLILQTMGMSSMLASVGITFVFLVVIYGGYFIITYLCSKSIIRP